MPKLVPDNIINYKALVSRFGKITVFADGEYGSVSKVHIETETDRFECNFVVCNKGISDDEHLHRIRAQRRKEEETKYLKKSYEYEYYSSKSVGKRDLHEHGLVIMVVPKFEREIKEKKKFRWCFSKQPTKIVLPSDIYTQMVSANMLMNYQKINITPKMANKSFYVEWCHDGIVMKCSVFCSDFANSWGGQIDECSYNGVDIILKSMIIFRYKYGYDNNEKRRLSGFNERNT